MSGPVPIPRRKKRSSSDSDSPRLSASQFNLRHFLRISSSSPSHNELKENILRLMFEESDERKPVIISQEKSKFQFLIMIFNQFNSKHESCRVDALNTIMSKHLPRCFSDDLPMYMLLIHKIIQQVGFHRCEKQRVFVSTCVEKFEAMESKQVATVMNSFVERGDFVVDLESIFSMLKDASLGCLSVLQPWFDEHQSHTLHSRNSHRYPHVYLRFLWISVVIKFGNDESSLIHSLWDENVLKYCSEMILDSRLVKEVGKGLQLGSQLELPKEHTFGSPHMADFIVKSKTMRSLVAVEYYFRVIEHYIKDNAELMNFLSSLRSMYQVWLGESTTATLATLSYERTLCGVNSEGINFTNCIHEVCIRHNVEPAIIVLECIEWLQMLIQTVDFTNDLAKIHLKQFLSSEPAILQLEECRKAIIKCICDGTLSSLSQMTIEQFGSLFSALGVYNASIVEDFVKNYTFPANFKINDPAFIIFLNKIVSKCKGAESHSFLIPTVFKSASDLYIADGRDQDYLTDLFEVCHKVPGLFAKKDEVQEGVQNEGCLAFKEFLRSIIHVDSIKNVISTPNTMSCIVSHLAVSDHEDSECKKLLFDVLCEYILKCDSHNDLPHVLRSATATLCKDMSWMQSSITLKQKFCLKCIAACCSRIRPPQASSNALQWVQADYDIIMELGRTYNSYCHRNGLTNKNGYLTCTGQQQLHTELLSNSIEDVKRYFEWVHEVQDILKELNDRLVHQETAIHAIMSIKDSENKNFECLSFMLCVQSSVNIREMKQICSSLLKEVNKILLKSIPGQPHSKVTIFPELLCTYHVILPKNLQEMLSKYVVYPSEQKERWSLVEQSHFVADRQSQPDSEHTVELSRSITLSQLAAFVDELNKFHEPIKKFTAMLTFFTFHDSTLFHQCLNAQNLNPIKEPQSLQIRDATIPFQHKQFDMDLPCFVSCLENAQKVILKLLDGQGDYTDIVKIDPEGHLEIITEVEILRQYSAVFGVDCNGLMKTYSMLNLHRLVHQAHGVIFVCHQFKLEECLRDSRLHELQKQVLELKSEAVSSRFNLMPTDISRKLKHMKKLLCITEDTDIQCLDLFPAVKAHCSDKLSQLMLDEQCHLRHKDVAKHLQHEASALHDLSSAMELMSPFLDVDQKFESMMIQVIEKGNVKQGIQTLKKVDGQLSVINEVFSSISPALCREEKLSAIHAKEDNQRLREKIAEYELQFKQITEEKAKIQERLDYLEMEHKALLRNKKEHHQETHNLQTNISKLTLQSRALEKENEAKQAKIQVVSEAKESLQQENCTLRQEKQMLQQNLSVVQSKNDQYRLSQQELIACGLQPWKISRERIKLGKVIGGGGWGAVLEGDLKVAFKQFYPAIIVSSQNLARLRREMEMLARIRHPNLVQFIGVVFEDDDNADIHANPPYILTELLDMSLREAYEKGQVSDDNLCPIFQDTARALDYLHRRHEPIVHRDVSSANVLLKRLPNGMWLAKVSDLGSANLAKDAFTKNEGAIIYCAPEAFTDKGNTHSETLLTSKMDIYSYGIMLCEVINRTLPNQDELQFLLQ